MPCEHGDVIHGYLDGELDAARALELEEHVQTCEICRARLDEHEGLRASMLAARLYAKAPAGVRESVESVVRGDAARTARRGLGPSRRSLITGAAALCAAVTLVIVARPSGDRALLTGQLIDAHLRAMQPGHGVDVVSTDQHTVKPWFDGKLDFSPPVHDYADQGFALQGGRLDVVGGRAVAAMMYARRKHAIDLFVWPAADGEAWPTADGDAGPSSGSARGYQWVRWRKAGMEMRLVSDVAMADMMELQALMAR